MKYLTAFVISLILFFAPVAEAAESEIATESALFFTQSEEENDIDRSISPVVWVFVALGVGALVIVGTLTFVNRRQKM